MLKYIKHIPIICFGLEEINKCEKKRNNIQNSLLIFREDILIHTDLTDVVKESHVLGSLEKKKKRKINVC